MGTLRHKIEVYVWQVHIVLCEEGELSLKGRL
ncbi:hypothetical protein E2C01_101951 [Portunus trituberculatus]|uniref:Uncharacterized protein n=1 Tax=Portunus trituberculatus TaxID=210409 RepID=A0A5B7KLL0_PORTR|nr:hypothetical protein [Portunus trituberculatus]